MMAVVKHISEDRVKFHCPGCKMNHQIQIGTGVGTRWAFNGDYSKPTFSPSVLCTWSEPNDDPAKFDFPCFDVQKVCHSFVVNGVIQFLNDCTHDLAGKNVPMVELD